MGGFFRGVAIKCILEDIVLRFWQENLAGKGAFIMRRKPQGILLGLIAFSLIVGVAHVPQAEAISVLGIETGQTTWEYNVVSFIPGLSFTLVSQADFATVNLNAFDVLFIR